MHEPRKIIAEYVGQRLKDLRGKLTQAEFAARMGMSQAQYNLYETGRRLAPDKILRQVAQVCGLDVQTVIWGDKTAPDQPKEEPETDFAQDIAELARLLDKESLEDLYYFLKDKTRDLSRRQKEVAKQAQTALEERLKKIEGGA